MKENDVSQIIINHCIQIHTALGPGLLESVYEEVLHFELRSAGLKVDRQKSIPIIWKGQKMELGFRCDLIVEDLVLVELKSIEQINPVHCKQVLTYLSLTNLKLGLLINFNDALLKTGIRRLVNGL